MQSRRIIIIACINTVYKAQITWYRKYEIKWNIAIANSQEKKNNPHLLSIIYAVGKLCCGEKKQKIHSPWNYWKSSRAVRQITVLSLYVGVGKNSISLSCHFFFLGISLFPHFKIREQLLPLLLSSLIHSSKHNLDKIPHFLGGMVSKRHPSILCIGRERKRLSEFGQSFLKLTIGPECPVYFSLTGKYAYKSLSFWKT